MERLNKIKNKKKEENNKFRHVKKSEFIGEKAKQLQKQIEHNYEKDKNNNDDKSFDDKSNDDKSSDSEKYIVQDDNK